jgi:quinol-cytochrome oxidoreductase complex cytochrome b subunit
MNAREKEEYLREYSILKTQGKPFFPYAVFKDTAMAAITLGVIILMAVLLGAELGPKADPTRRGPSGTSSFSSSCCGWSSRRSWSSWPPSASRRYG